MNDYYVQHNTLCTSVSRYNNCSECSNVVIFVVVVEHAKPCKPKYLQLYKRTDETSYDQLQTKPKKYNVI